MAELILVYLPYQYLMLFPTEKKFAAELSNYFAYFFLFKTLFSFHFIPMSVLPGYAYAVASSLMLSKARRRNYVL